MNSKPFSYADAVKKGEMTSRQQVENEIKIEKQQKDDEFFKSIEMTEGQKNRIRRMELLKSHIQNSERSDERLLFIYGLLLMIKRTQNEWNVDPQFYGYEQHVGYSDYVSNLIEVIEEVLFHSEDHVVAFKFQNIYCDLLYEKPVHPSSMDVSCLHITRGDYTSESCRCMDFSDDSSSSTPIEINNKFLEINRKFYERIQQTNKVIGYKY